MNYILFNILSVIVGISIPLIVQKLKGKTSEGFGLGDLSTVLSILIVYYAILFVFSEISFNESALFNLFILLHIVLTSVLIAATARFTPLKKSIRGLLKFPRLRLIIVPQIAILIFFLYTSFIIYSSVEEFAGRLDLLGPANLIFLEAVYNSPFTALPILVLTELFSVAGEEIVCRYFAIGALRQKLRERTVVVISSLIWTLMHWDAGISIFILGLLLGILYYETESLSICISLHFIYNAAVLTLPFYLFFRQSEIIQISPFQYVSAIFAAQILLYGSVVIIFAKVLNARLRNWSP